MKRLFLVLLAFGLVIFIAPPAKGETISFDFDSGPGDYFSVINTGGIWNINLDGPTLRISKTDDDGTVSGDGYILGGISSNFYLGGDFVATVDFSLSNFPATPEPGKYNESLFAFVNDDGYLFEVLRFRSGSNDKVEAYANPPGTPFGQTNSTLYSGSYRITRTNTTIIAQYAPPGSTDFVTIATLAGFTGDNLKLILEAVQGRGPNDSIRSLTAMDIAFDNLYIEAGSITPSVAPVPEPATMLLLASGLVGLAGLRRKFYKH